MKPNKRFERDAPPASFACCLRAPQAERWADKGKTMKKSICKSYIAMSIDGYIAGKNNDLTWLDEYNSMPDLINGLTYDNFINTIDCIIMGKNTYEKVCTFEKWPYENKKVIVLTNSGINNDGFKKYIYKTSNGNPREIIKDANENNCKSLYIDGGNTICNFIKENCLDEIIITRIPKLLCEGIKLFNGNYGARKMKLIKSSVSKYGVVQDVYQINKTAQQGVAPEPAPVKYQ